MSQRDSLAAISEALEPRFPDLDDFELVGSTTIATSASAGVQSDPSVSDPGRKEQERIFAEFAAIWEVKTAAAAGFGWPLEID